MSCLDELFDTSIAPEVKRCRRCNQERPVEEFWPSSRSADGLTVHCRQCRLELAAKRRNREQGRMGRKATMYEYNGQRGTLHTLSAQAGKSYKTIWRRVVKLGMPIADALEAPVRPVKRSKSRTVESLASGDVRGTRGREWCEAVKIMKKTTGHTQQAAVSLLVTAVLFENWLRCRQRAASLAAFCDEYGYEAPEGVDRVAVYRKVMQILTVAEGGVWAG